MQTETFRDWKERKIREGAIFPDDSAKLPINHRSHRVIHRAQIRATENRRKVQNIGRDW